MSRAEPSSDGLKFWVASSERILPLQQLLQPVMTITAWGPKHVVEGRGREAVPREYSWMMAVSSWWARLMDKHRGQSSATEESAFSSSHDTHHQHHSFFHKSWRTLTTLSLLYPSTLPNVGWFSFLNSSKIEVDTNTNSALAFSPLIWARFLSVVLHSHISLLVGVVAVDSFPRNGIGCTSGPNGCAV